MIVFQTPVYKISSKVCRDHGLRNAGFQFLLPTYSRYVVASTTASVVAFVLTKGRFVKQVSRVKVNAEADDDTAGPPAANEDWRDFRARLVAREDGRSWNAQKSSTENWNLLEQQDPVLSKSSFWAFETPGLLEVGSLLLQNPIELQVLADPELLEIVSDTMKEALTENEEPRKRLARWKQVQHWILETVSNLAEEMRRSPNKFRPSADQLKLLRRYADFEERWQQVILITKYEAEGLTEGIVLNRPAAYDAQEAVSLISAYGNYEGDHQAFCTCFAGSPVYFGGQDAKGMVILSRTGDGKELRPGLTDVPAKDALNARMSGLHSPSDFRIHLCKTSWKSADLVREVSLSRWRTVAASVALILKPCIRLPKPSWSEIMELCDGEAAELSRFVRGVEPDSD